ncbi:MAG TPA: glycosyltransferase [Nitrospirales bacterium]|nr:glycosyltransferase [Nitrospirales bacterium]
MIPHRKPRLLFMAYYFPPLNGSACVRTWNIAKYLARAGWDVTVLTVDPALWRNVNDPDLVTEQLRGLGIQRVVTSHRWRWLSPYDLRCWNTTFGWFSGGLCRRVARHYGVEGDIGWRAQAEQACAGIRPGDIDVILVTGPPFEGFRVAKRLARRLRCPYVLDYRDPWNLRRRRAAASAAARHEEVELLTHAGAVTVVSASLLRTTTALTGKCHVVSNGFDPEELSRVRPQHFGHFAIVYAGSFYPPQTTITPVMNALKTLKEIARRDGKDWRFHYYGHDGEHVAQEARRCGVTDRVVMHGHVPRAESLAAVRGCNVAIVITSVLEEKAEEARGVVTGKIFEPIGMRTPVLLIGPVGADVDAIVQKAGLIHKVTASNVTGMAAFLERVMGGSVPVAKDPDAYAWPRIIHQLDAALRGAIDVTERTACAGSLA